MPQKKYLGAITSLFATVLIVSNIVGSKIAEFHGIQFSAALTLFPISYIICDVLTEVYGYGQDRRIVWKVFAYNLLAVVIIQIAVVLPSATIYHDQEAFAKVLGQSPRLMIGSFAGFIAGSFLNSYVLAKLKVRTRGRYLWLRTIGSTLVGEAADTVLFNAIAFLFVFAYTDLARIAFQDWAIKCLFEVLATPVTYAVVRFLKRAEGVDHYDRATNFNPFTLS